ncbi:MAG: molecular chaperone TorD family protein [Desulfocapsaceae bacterium]|nr:molecular chaperone TorD family protein [Desulfocapsaceae bacterium]
MSQLETLATVESCFRLLSACFYEPEKDLFLEQSVCENLNRLLSSFSSEAAAHAQRMAVELSNQEQQQLALDHSALFIGPFELIAPPYGSVYLEKKREVMGETTLEVIKFYQDAGLQVEEREPADHIAIELEFMSFLHSRETAALHDGSTEEADRYRYLRRKFFSSWLYPWVAEFSRTIGEGTDNGFYQALAECLAAFSEAYQQRVVEFDASA